MSPLFSLQRLSCGLLARSTSYAAHVLEISKRHRLVKLLVLDDAKWAGGQVQAGILPNDEKGVPEFVDLKPRTRRRRQRDPVVGHRSLGRHMRLGQVRFQSLQDHIKPL